MTVTLPRGAAEVAPHDHQASTSNRAPTAPVVLVVEDDPDLRAYLVRLLTEDGWSVRAFADAETALESLGDQSAGHPDVVVTDVMLPGRSGLTLLRQLRETPATERTPIIVLTARHGDEAAGEGLAAGADDYITKPFSSSELLARVRATFELAALREGGVRQAEAAVANLRQALDRSRMIGTAVGMIMSRYRLTASQAFAILAQASQHTNRKLRDIAKETTDIGALPLRATLIDELLTKVSPGPTHRNSRRFDRPVIDRPGRAPFAWPSTRPWSR